MIENIHILLKQAVENGNWMLRRSSGGFSYRGFRWRPIGEWTEAPDWDPAPECGGGLHGCGPEAWGYFTEGETVDFCITDGPRIVIDKEKLKVPRAMVILRNDLGMLEGLQVGGSLDLRGTQITALPEGLQVGGSLDLRGTQITALPEGCKPKCIYWPVK